MPENNWDLDPPLIKEFVSLAIAEGLRPSSLDQGRGVLIRYSQFLRERFNLDLTTAGWKEFAAYKGHLAQSGIARTTARGYLSYIITFYRLKAQGTQDPQLLELFTKLNAIGMPRKAKSVKWTPFAPEVLTRVLEVAKAQAFVGEGLRAVPSEDYALLMTLLYTGGRAQFYGLRVSDLDFDRMEIKAIVKGGKPVTIPLHPTLADLLREHLASRSYQSESLFRYGKDSGSRTGQKANRQNAWRACKRIQEAAGLAESVHPHRFRKTTATMGKRLGLDPQFLQAILAHESVTMTLDRYAEVELDDVKREFAKLDLCNGQVASTQPAQAELIEHLKKQAPRGKEGAWSMILDGLSTILREGA
ncbi:MAG TPA: tyrosine-type recombinase/integrase [Thermoplasmata archaeon]